MFQHPFKMKWKYGLYCMFNYMIMVMLSMKHVKAKVAFSRLTASLWREPLHVVITSIHPVPQGRRDGEGGRQAERHRRSVWRRFRAVDMVWTWTAPVSWQLMLPLSQTCWTALLHFCLMLHNQNLWGMPSQAIVCKKHVVCVTVWIGFFSAPGTLSLTQALTSVTRYIYTFTCLLPYTLTFSHQVECKYKW